MIASPHVNETTRQSVDSSATALWFGRLGRASTFCRIVVSCHTSRKGVPGLVLRSLAIALSVSLATFSNPRAEAYYLWGTRWTNTASGSYANSPGTAVTLTWSLAPDGTNIPASADHHDAGTSSLISTLDDTFGAGPGGNDLTQRPWFTFYEQAFARMSELSGVTYVYEPNDDGSSFNNAAGVLGVRGDVRIGSTSFYSDSTILAYNFYPSVGDMVLNNKYFRASNFANPDNSYRYFRNCIMHESMHGMGIKHVQSDNAAFLIEPGHQTSFEGPQLDDILAMQRLYGDRYEKNGNNNTRERATQLGQLTPSQSIAIGTLGDSTVVNSTDLDFVSISGTADSDYFSFTIPANSIYDVNLQLTPRGTTYRTREQLDPPPAYTNFFARELNDLQLRLYNSAGALLNSSNNTPAGGDEAITRQLTPGTYYARISGSIDDVQLYGLNLLAAFRNLTWVGSVNSTWSASFTANFQQASGVTAFTAGDNVRFDDTSSVKTVTISGNVAPTDMRVTTSTSYDFIGTGGVTSQRLIVDGTGTVTLSNTGSSDYGDVLAESGTLKVISAANSKNLSVNSAAFQIEGGGDVVNQLGGYVGFEAGSNGSATVTGAGSTWANDFLYVGYNGTGTLDVSSGGSVTSSLGSVGYRSTGSIAISGSNSQWEVTELLLVGEHGNGELTVQSGGNLSSKDLYLGSFSDSEGTVTVTGSGALLQNSGSLYVGGTNNGPGGAGTLNIADNALVTVDDTLYTWADGAVNLSGGKLKTSALDIAAGAFQMTGGQLAADVVTGSLTNDGGSLAPGDTTLAGLTTIAGDYTQLADATLEIELGGQLAELQYDQLVISGSANLAGTLTVDLLDLGAGIFAPTLGQTFDVLEVGASLSGVFTDLSLPTLGAGLGWEVNYLADRVQLAVVAAVGTPGDFNGDGIVDGRDFLAWQRNPNSGSLADWQTNYGNNALNAAVSVPEPTMSMMLLASAIALSASRYRPRREN